MTPIDNSGLQQFCHSCGAVGFTPGVSFSLNTGTKILTVTSTSVFPTGDGLKVVNVIVSDRFGNVKNGQITVAATPITINLSADFNLTEGFNIQATIVSNKRLIADLTAYGVYANTGLSSGVLGYADIETDEVE